MIDEEIGEILIDISFLFPSLPDLFLQKNDRTIGAKQKNIHLLETKMQEENMQILRRVDIH
jgi:hypothetical protein